MGASRIRLEHWHSPTVGDLKQYAEFVREQRVRLRQAKPGIRRRNELRELIYWSHALAAARAANRAEAGDEISARRLAWLKAVHEERRHGRWLVERFRSHNAVRNRLFLEGASAACLACSKRLAQAEKVCAEYIREVTDRIERPVVSTWGEWRRAHPVVPGLPSPPANVIDFRAARIRRLERRSDHLEAVTDEEGA